MSDLDLNTARELVHRSDGMSAAEAAMVVDLLLAGSLEAEVGGDLLINWAERGETSTELAGVVRHLRSQAVAVNGRDEVLDVVGTGGSGLTRFNVSTTVAFVCAAAGASVAKHGNKGSRRPNGSFDLLDALGIPYPAAPQALERLLEETGVCFCFARALHPAMKAAVPYRQHAGRRTIFNLAGPLSNPVACSHQVVGVCDAGTAEVVAGALAELAPGAAVVVRGHPGLDEVSVTGDSHWIHLAGGERRVGLLDRPPHAGLDYSSLPGGDGVENAGHFRRLVAGEERGPLFDLVARSAGVALDLWNGHLPSEDSPGRAQAVELLADGSVAAVVDDHRHLALELSGR